MVTESIFMGYYNTTIALVWLCKPETYDTLSASCDLFISQCYENGTSPKDIQMKLV